MTERSENSPAERQVDRRGLLRTGGAAVVAGMAGFAVAEVASAGPAGAASGSDLVIDADNEGTGTTLLNSAVDGATLSLGNSVGVQLNLVDTEFPGNVDFETGDLASYDGDLYFTNDITGGGDLYTSYAFTYGTANQVLPITPQRVVDTRNTAGRQWILNPSALDSTGRLKGGQTIVIDLTTQYEQGCVAAFCNITADAPSAPGFAVVFPGGKLPPTSSVNFAKGAAVANFAVTGITAGENGDTISIYAQVTTHIILDITAFSGTVFDINPDIFPGSPFNSTPASARRAKAARKTPAWQRGAR